MRSRFLATYCACATLVAALFGAQVSYECSMTGRRQSHCCCATGASSESGGAGGQVTAPCCERTIAVDDAPLATQRSDPNLSIAWALGPLLAVVPEPIALAPRHALTAQTSRGPPEGLPLYLRDCRYLL